MPPLVSPRLARASSKKAKGSTKPQSGRTRLVVLGVALIVLLVAVVYGLEFTGPSQSGSGTAGSTSTATTTSYNVLADGVISSAAGDIPGGYAQGASKSFSPDESGLLTADFTIYTNQAGSFANMTIIVFSSEQAAQAYGTSVINNAKGLSGYTDVTSSLTDYARYGVCYGYAEADPEGLEYVANGVCTKGNVYISVHIASNLSLPTAEGDMAGFVEAAYNGLH